MSEMHDERDYHIITAMELDDEGAYDDCQNAAEYEARWWQIRIDELTRRRQATR